jgi:hypothetical protein
MAEVQRAAVGVGGTGVQTSRRTVGRGTQIITVTGAQWRDVQREAAAVWHAADVWLRQQVPPFAHPTPDGGFSATIYIDDAE